MARINIEDSLFSEKRFIKLAFQLGGDCEKALGALVYFWKTAQSFYLKNGGWITKEKWKELELNPAILECGFTETDVDGRQRPLDSDTYFGWLKQRSKAGKRSQEARRTASVEIIEESSQHPSTTVNEPSTSYSCSSSKKNIASKKVLEKSNVKAKNEVITPSETKNSFSHDAIKLFCERWKSKYNASYSFLPKEVGLLNGQFKGFSIERFQKLVEAFFEMNERSFLDRRHSFTELYYNLNKVSHYSQTGMKISKFAIEQHEKQERNQEVLDLVKKELRK